MKMKANENIHSSIFLPHGVTKLLRNIMDTERIIFKNLILFVFLMFKTLHVVYPGVKQTTNLLTIYIFITKPSVGRLIAIATCV